MFSTEIADKILKYLMKKHGFDAYEIDVKYVKHNGKSYLKVYNNGKFIGYVYYISNNPYSCLMLDVKRKKDARIEDFVDKMFELSRKGFKIYVLPVKSYKQYMLLNSFESLEEVLVKMDLEDDFS